MRKSGSVPPSNRQLDTLAAIARQAPQGPLEPVVCIAGGRPAGWKLFYPTEEGVRMYAEVWDSRLSEGEHMQIANYLQATRPSVVLLLIEELMRVRTALAEAAREINCAGPVAHRIQVLKRDYSEHIQRLEAHIDAARDQSRFCRGIIRAAFSQCQRCAWGHWLHAPDGWYSEWVHGVEVTETDVTIPVEPCGADALWKQFPELANCAARLAGLPDEAEEAE